MENEPQQKRSATTARFDRMCEHLAMKRSADTPWGLDPKRGALDLRKDRAQHRRFHSLYEDLLN